jgi:uncharacterized membrane protein
MACGGGGAEGTGIDIDALECPPGSTLTFTNYAGQWIQDHCLRCHSGQEKPMLTSYESIQANERSILEVTVATTQMPEEESISLEERQMLGEWIACGEPL